MEKLEHWSNASFVAHAGASDGNRGPTGRYLGMAQGQHAEVLLRVYGEPGSMTCEMHRSVQIRCDVEDELVIIVPPGAKVTIRHEETVPTPYNG